VRGFVILVGLAALTILGWATAEPWVVLAGAAAIGFVVGWIFRWTFAATQRRDLESKLNAARSELTACQSELAYLDAHRPAAPPSPAPTGPDDRTPPASPGLRPDKRL